MKNEVRNEDSLEALSELPDKEFDAIITDPPYFLGFSSSDDGDRNDYGNQTMLKPLFKNLFKQFKRVLKDDGKLFVFMDWRTYPVVYPIAKQFIEIPNCIVWDYDWIKAGQHFRFTHEFILYGAMPEYDGPEDRSISDVWKVSPVNFTQERNHPAEKPVEIIEKMLQHTTEKKDYILDPFCGSGTTGVASKRLGRQFLGYEINERYVRLSRERISSKEMQVSLSDMDDESGLLKFQQEEVNR